jgi:hypothetical protein
MKVQNKEKNITLNIYIKKTKIKKEKKNEQDFRAGSFETDAPKNKLWMPATFN